MTKTKEQESITINRPDRSTYLEENSVSRSGTTPITPGLWRRTNAGPANESPQTHHNGSENSSLPHTIEHETMSMLSS